MCRALAQWPVVKLALVLGSMLAFAVASPTAAYGKLFVEVNSADGNSVVVIRAAGDGTLRLGRTWPTRGRGTGAGLENQGALAVGRRGTRLYAVNAASDSISVFAIRRRSLHLFDRAPSGGEEPVSVTVRKDRLYVLNRGQPNNITGFAVSRFGGLSPLPGATRALSDPNAGPAQVGFSPDGSVLAVTERITHRVLAFPLSPSGPRAPSIVASPKPRPFGFDFHGDNLVVSEAGAETLGASSYRLGDDRRLRLVSSPVIPDQRGACWTAITPDGRYAYVTNTGSSSITGFRLGRDGRLDLLDPTGVTAQMAPMTRPTDVVAVGRYLYVLSIGTNTVSSFAVSRSGALTPVSSVHVGEGSLTGLVSE